MLLVNADDFEENDPEENPASARQQEDEKETIRVEVCPRFKEVPGTERRVDIFNSPKRLITPRLSIV
jgi:hypothetical protein